MDGGLGLLLLLVGIAIVFRLMAGGLDGDRIEAYLRERGCKVLDRSWAPFGKGWFGEKSDRIYEVVYRDRHGATRRATVKTSMFTGVYLTEDRLVKKPKEQVESRRRDAVEVAAEERETGSRDGDEVARLRAENQQLRAALQQRDLQDERS